MITMSYKRIHKYQFFIPFSIFILFILETEKTSDKYLIVIHNLAKPPRVHHYYFLTTLIPNFFFTFIP